MAFASENSEHYSESTKVWRRIHPTQVVEKEDGETRPTSAAFSDPSDGTAMSVDIDEGQDPSESIRDHEGFGLVSLRIDTLEALGFEVVRVPLPGNLHHAEVRGKKTGGKKREMANSAEWVSFPDRPNAGS